MACFAQCLKFFFASFPPPYPFHPPCSTGQAHVAKNQPQELTALSGLCRVQAVWRSGPGGCVGRIGRPVDLRLTGTGLRLTRTSVTTTNLKLKCPSVLKIYNEFVSQCALHATERKAAEEAKRQAVALRRSKGNPFRNPVSISPSALSLSTSHATITLSR